MLLPVLLEGEPQSGVIWHESFRQSPYPNVLARCKRRADAGDIKRRFARVLCQRFAGLPGRKGELGIELSTEQQPGGFRAHQYLPGLSGLFVHRYDTATMVWHPSTAVA